MSSCPTGLLPAFFPTWEQDWARGSGDLQASPGYPGASPPLIKEHSEGREA